MVDVTAKVGSVEKRVESVTQSDVELVISSCFIVSKALPVLPFLLEHASLPDSVYEEQERLEARKAKERERLEARQAKEQGLLDAKKEKVREEAREKKKALLKAQHKGVRKVRKQTETAVEGLLALQSL